MKRLLELAELRELCARVAEEADDPRYPGTVNGRILAAQIRSVPLTVESMSQPEPTGKPERV